MRRSDAEEVREQLLELLDERHEAGPTAYVVERVTAEPVGGADWALVLVFRPTEGEPPVGVRFAELAVSPGGEPVTTESLGWHAYNALEAGRLAPAAGEPDTDGIRWT